MISYSLNKDQFSDFINLYHGVFFPLKNFVNQKEFLEILNKKRIRKNFFPFPIFFGINKKFYKKIEKENHINLYYKKKNLALVKIIQLYKIDKKKFGKKIYGNKFKFHPYFKKFNKENYAFLSFKLLKTRKKNLRHYNFVSPLNFKEKVLGQKKLTLAGFHTRNVPHSAHQWAHNYMIKKYKRVLLQPLVGQYKLGEYLDNIIIKSNKVASEMYVKGTAFFTPYFSYPRYAGPREAALHAIVRKNYGCTHFWVGRDHAGYKNFFSKYDSQKFCKKNQKRLRIKIIAQKEPFFCYGCNKIVNTKCMKKKCNNSMKETISGTKIRNFIKKNKKIPSHLMNKKISSILNNKSLI